MQYVGMMWQAVGDVAMKLSAANIGKGFSAGDGVTVSGCTGAAVDGTWTLLQCSDNIIVIGAAAAIEGEQTTAVTVRRYVPDMDFVVECGNRLWGCKYGIVDGRSVNAVYGSALGDFRNWNTFAGLSTDSYAADRPIWGRCCSSRSTAWSGFTSAPRALTRSHRCNAPA